MLDCHLRCSVGSLQFGEDFVEGRTNGFARFEAEGAFDAAEDLVALLFVKLTVGIELLELLGAVPVGGEFAVFLEVNDLADEAGKAVEETAVFERVFGEFLL